MVFLSLIIRIINNINVNYINFKKKKEISKLE